MKEHIYGYAATLATLLSLPTLAEQFRKKDDAVRDEVVDVISRDNIAKVNKPRV